MRRVCKTGRSSSLSPPPTILFYLEFSRFLIEGMGVLRIEVTDALRLCLAQLGVRAGTLTFGALGGVTLRVSMFGVAQRRDVTSKTIRLGRGKVNFCKLVSNVTFIDVNIDHEPWLSFQSVS